MICPVCSKVTDKTGLCQSCGAVSAPKPGVRNKPHSMRHDRTGGLIPFDLRNASEREKQRKLRADTLEDTHE